MGERGLHAGSSKGWPQPPSVAGVAPASLGDDSGEGRPEVEAPGLCARALLSCSCSAGAKGDGANVVGAKSEAAHDEERP